MILLTLVGCKSQTKNHNVDYYILEYKNYDENIKCPDFAMDKNSDLIYTDFQLIDRTKNEELCRCEVKEVLK